MQLKSKSLCKMDVPANNGSKRGRPSTSSLRGGRGVGELEKKKRRAPAQPIPAKQVRLDLASQWAVWLDAQQKCKYPDCREYNSNNTLTYCNKV